MKVALSLVLLATVVALVQGAPANQKRLLLDIGGCMPAMCFIDPCVMASCPSHPTATCRQGCACSADFYDLAGHKLTC